MIVALAIYANSLTNGFVGDDHSVILNNPALMGSTLSLFSVIDTPSDTQFLPFYRPVAYLTFLVEYRLHDFRPLLMHLGNVLLHAANAFLVYRLARVFLIDKWSPLLAGLLFAVHPLHSEGVNFLSGGRNTMLACFFILMAYLVHHRSIIREKFSYAVFGSLFFLGGLFSKEVAIAVLPFILVLEISLLNQESTRSRSRAIVRLLPYALAVSIYLYMRWLTLSRLGIQTSILPGVGTQKLVEMSVIIPSLLERLSSNLYIIPKYLFTVLYPLRLSPRYVVPADLQSVAVLLIVAWLFIITIAAWLLTKGRSSTTLFGLIWTMAFWLPVSGVVYFSGIPLADRFLYIPAIGLWLVIADQVGRLVRGSPLTRKYVFASAVMILVVLGGLTMRRNLDWKSDITLFSRLIEQYPDNPHGHFNLASALIERRGPNDMDLAEESFARALGLDPSNQFVYTPLGYIKLSKGKFEDALYYYTKALEISPSDRDARINRGIAYEKMGRYQEALADYQYYLSIAGYNNIPGSDEYAKEKVRELSRK